MSLEEMLKELEAIADKLEQGGISLDESVKLYEQGVGLTKKCLAQLAESKSKIAEIKAEMTKLTENI